MEKKSFYDLDYIIEMNEQRLEQVGNDYQKVTERFTNLVLIYSVITIFLLPIIEDIFLLRAGNWFFVVCFICFAMLFVVSVYYTVRLMLPVGTAELDPPQTFYMDKMMEYERYYDDEAKIDALLKASYIWELQDALRVNQTIYSRKKGFYYRAFSLALLALVPYIICIGFHIAKGENATEDIPLIHQKNL